MKIRIDILNPEIFSTRNSDLTSDGATWHMRSKSYETDWMDDEDIKNCVIGHTLD